MPDAGKDDALGGGDVGGGVNPCYAVVEEMDGVDEGADVA